MMKLLKITSLLLMVLWLSACSMGQMVARSSVSILDGAVDAMNRETDLVLAESAIPANLKLMEGLIAEDPGNTDLRTYAAQGFYGYAFGFTELDDARRASALYQRGFDHGVSALQEQGLKIDLQNSHPDKIKNAANKLSNKSVPALFWTASNWGKQIDLNRDDPTRLAQMSSVEALMQRVTELQPDYYYGSAHLFYGVYYGSRSPMFGGDFKQSELNFNRARAVSDSKLLIIDVLQAEYLERQRLNQENFHRLLTGVIETPVGSFPEMELVNQIARERARFLLEKEGEWF
ncbi:MAG: TRAP transporter TatT component family protein [Gammaproteobacteria bacterium]